MARKKIIARHPTMLGMCVLLLIYNIYKNTIQFSPKNYLSTISIYLLSAHNRKPVEVVRTPTVEKEAVALRGSIPEPARPLRYVSKY